ncbi:MAG: hypothetical protein K2K93_06440 [Muribaculaceae bacterium]|nr:hypothetical protein [Muribaculaceae bacterium]
MKFSRFIYPAVIVLAIGGAGCRRSNPAKERVQAEREKWEASLPDSLKAVERQTDSIRAEIKTLGQELDAMLPDFDYVDNPREVEGYYIAKTWKDSYPMNTTGLRGRLTKGERLELVATLAGGAHFDRLRVEADNSSAETSAVPHDQALNYRMEGLNTVCFSDSAANSCARLIADAQGQVTLIYLEGDRTTGKLTYPQKDKATMALTWKLFDTRREMTLDERMLPLLAKKGAIIASRIESLKSN